MCFRHTNCPQELTPRAQHRKWPGMCTPWENQGCSMVAEPFKEPPQVTSIYWRTKGKQSPENQREAKAKSQHFWAGRSPQPEPSGPRARHYNPQEPSGSSTPPTNSKLTVSVGSWVTHTSTPWVSLGSSPTGVARWWDHSTWQNPLSKAPFIQMDKKRIEQAFSYWLCHLWQSPWLTYSVIIVVLIYIFSALLGSQQNWVKTESSHMLPVPPQA